MPRLQAGAGLVNDLEPTARAVLDQGAAELWRGGRRVGHVTTALEKGWGTGRPLGTQTVIWLLVTRDDGVRYVIEDYPPYATVPDALAGHLRPENSTEDLYEVRWLANPERQGVWQQQGIHDRFGSYRPEGSRPTDWAWSHLVDRLRRRRR